MDGCPGQARPLLMKIIGSVNATPTSILPYIYQCCIGMQVGFQPCPLDTMMGSAINHKFITNVQQQAWPAHAQRRRRA